MRILIISSLSPYKSANYGKRLIDVFQNAGYEVDYLTKYRFEGMDKNMISVYDTFEPPSNMISRAFRSKMKDVIFSYFPFIKGFLKKEITQSVIPLNEDSPEVDAQLVVDKIEKKYDVVYVSFWQFMLTTKSLRLIYEKLHVPIFMGTVDMYPMTGGCYYFNECKNYQKECINCPAASLFESEDIPHQNYLYKKDVYQTINCLYLCNQWMKERVLKSSIISEKKVITSLNSSGNPSFLLEEDKYSLRKELNLPHDKFIIFAGAANVRLRRKGFQELTAALNEFATSIGTLDNVIVILAGRNNENFQHYFKFKINHVGFLSTEKLAKMYRTSDLYLSPSIDDAGPSMVVQSLLSGTPVVAFNIGVAPEVIIHKETGYIAQLADTKDFSNGISYIYNLNVKERQSMSEKCRSSIIKTRNPERFINKFEELYEKFREK